MLAIKNADISICKSIEYLGDKLSLYVYIFHVPVSIVINFISSKVIRININSMIYQWMLPVLTVIVVILVALMLNIIIQKYLIVKSKLLYNTKFKTDF